MNLYKWEDYDLDLQNKFYFWFWMGGKMNCENCIYVNDCKTADDNIVECDDFKPSAKYFKILVNRRSKMNLIQGGNYEEEEKEKSCSISKKEKL